IDYLCITLVTDDCHYSILTNDVRLQEYFIENKLYIQHPVFTHPKLYKQGLILPEHFGLERFQCTQGQVNQNFDINSIVSLNIGNHRQALCFHFMSRACEQLYKLLAMGTHILYKYVDFFLKNYQALIQELKNNLVDTS